MRPARWPEYFGLAAMAATAGRGGDTRSRPRRRPLHEAGLWLTVMFRLAAYGGLTTSHRQALATSWVIGENEWCPVLRAAPAIGLLCLVELALFIFGPPWTPLATFAVLAVAMFRLGRRWLARAELRDNRRPGAVYIGNLVSAQKGAGRVLLDHIVADAGARGLVTCLEARAQQAARALATTVGVDERGDINFFTDVALDLLWPLFYAAHIGGRSMADVLMWVLTREQPSKTSRGEVAEILDAELVSDDVVARRNAAQALATLGSALDCDPRTQSSIFITAQRLLRAWQDPAVQACTRSCEIDLDWLLGGNNTLYVCAPLDGTSAWRPSSPACSAP